MRLLSYNYAIYGQFLFSHTRRHRNPPKKRAEHTLKPYQYFLNYTYPPIAVGSITGNSVKYIPLYDFSNHFKRLRSVQKGGLVNHYIYQRFLKIRIVLLEMEMRRKWESALSHGRKLFNQVKITRFRLMTCIRITNIRRFTRKALLIKWCRYFKSIAFWRIKKISKVFVYSCKGSLLIMIGSINRFGKSVKP